MFYFSSRLFASAEERSPVIVFRHMYAQVMLMTYLHRIKRKGKEEIIVGESFLDLF